VRAGSYAVQIEDGLSCCVRRRLDRSWGLAGTDPRKMGGFRFVFAAVAVLAVGSLNAPAGSGLPTVAPLGGHVLCRHP